MVARELQGRREFLKTGLAAAAAPTLIGTG